ncbi:MAG TPA: FimV/HubP family polar landmark protein [Macromonas sp.]|nr:FimV/HubP family polar landmark protein [Macromonas sp.]
MQLIPSNAWDRPTDTSITTGPARSWGMRAVASAVLLATTLGAPSAWALALGKISVQSRLGQALRAEIDLPSISAEEAASLQVGVASPETFQAAGMEFNPLLSEVRFILERRPNGHTVLRLSSERAVVEPFLDMVVDVNWANGHLARGYTMLFDPPNLKTPAPAPVLPASVGRAPSKAAAPKVTAPTETTAPATPAPRVPNQPENGSDAATQVKVQAGDTAGRIAMANKPANVTLEQMLVGMLRANPHAFVGSNVNRMKAGVVLDLPTEAAASEVTPAEARRLIAAQSQDFNDYRRRLAELAPRSAEQAPARSASGNVQAEVTEQQPSPATPDKLTLSKGTVKTADSTEAKIADERQKAETTTRQSELNRNLEELKQLNTAASGTEPAPQAAPETAPQPAGPVVEAAPPAPPQQTPPPAPAQPKPPEPAKAPEAGIGDFVLGLLSHPQALPVGGGLAALLALMAGLRLYRRRKTSALQDGLDADESMLEAGGGQIVDTDEAAAGPVSSMMYSPSQLDAGGEVDPIAEADVYLAYGRDKQAEEILLEALRLHPDKLNVRLKLLEIYAQRRDTFAFAGMATEVFQMTEGHGSDWEQARGLGHSIDPANPLYQGNAPAEPAPLASSDIDLDLDSEPHPSAPEMPSLDLELPAVPASDVATEAAPPSEPAPADDNGLDFDFDLGAIEPALSEPAAPAADTPTASDDLGLDFDLDLSAGETPAAAATPPASVLPEEVQGLSLDLDTATEEAPATEPDFDMLANLEVNEGSSGNDPLETKLSLAQEFEAIGDTEGARSLAEEVLTEATGELKARAQAFLSQLP